MILHYNGNVYVSLMYLCIFTHVYVSILKVDPNDQILKKLKLKTHSYIGFGFNVTQIFLSQFNLTCTLRYCYSCGRL